MVEDKDIHSIEVFGGDRLIFGTIPRQEKNDNGIIEETEAQNLEKKLQKENVLDWTFGVVVPTTCALTAGVLGARYLVDNPEEIAKMYLVCSIAGLLVGEGINALSYLFAPRGK